MVGAAATADGDRDDTTARRHVPKAIVTPRPVPPATAARRPQRRESRGATTVIYELHVRGYTRSHPACPSALRGTCAGLAHPAAIEHLVAARRHGGRAAAVAAAIDEPHLAKTGLVNYWGYNTIALLVPDPRLAPDGIGELRECVDALHAAGIEVILDVVLNHSGEGDALRSHALAARPRQRDLLSARRR
jgi:pullulanase/glycogen debranching enzyme